MRLKWQGNLHHFCLCGPLQNTFLVWIPHKTASFTAYQVNGLELHAQMWPMWPPKSKGPTFPVPFYGGQCKVQQLASHFRKTCVQLLHPLKTSHMFTFRSLSTLQTLGQRLPYPSVEPSTALGIVCHEQKNESTSTFRAMPLHVHRPSYKALLKK